MNKEINSVIPFTPEQLLTPGLTQEQIIIMKTHNSTHEGLNDDLRRRITSYPRIYLNARAEQEIKRFLDNQVEPLPEGLAHTHS